MNKRVLKTVSLILFMSIVITGCSNSLENQNNALKKEISEINNIKTGLENTIKDLRNKLEEQGENNKGSISTFQSKTNGYFMGGQLFSRVNGWQTYYCQID